MGVEGGAGGTDPGGVRRGENGDSGFGEVGIVKSPLRDGGWVNGDWAWQTADETRSVTTQTPTRERRLRVCGEWGLVCGERGLMCGERGLVCGEWGGIFLPTLHSPHSTPV